MKSHGKQLLPGTVLPDRMDAIDSPADTEVLAYDATTGRFEWVANGAGGGESNTASNTGTLGTGLFKQKTGVDLEFYKLLGREGVAVALSGTDYAYAQLDISGLSTIGAAVDAANDYLALYDANIASHVKITPTILASALVSIIGGSLALGDLSDVTITGVANKDVLVYNSTSGDWENVTIASFASSVLSAGNLNDLGDVTAPSPSTNQVLTWNGSAWVNATPSGSGGGAVPMGFSGAATIVAKGSTDFLGVGTGKGSTTEANQQFRVRRSGTVQNLDTYVSANGTGAAGNTITMMKNGVAQTLATSYGSGVTGWQSDTSNTFAVVAGDLLSIRVVNTGSGGGTKDLVVESVCFEIA